MTEGAHLCQGETCGGRVVRGTTDDPIIYCDELGVHCRACSERVFIAHPYAARANGKAKDAKR